MSSGKENPPPSPHVLRVRRSDEADSHVLVHVSRSSSAAFELTILATEGSNPYIITLSQSQIKSLKAKNYQGNNEDWQNTLLHVLGFEDSPANTELFAGVETSASIDESEEGGDELVITVRKRIGNITQKWGSITLKQDNEQEVNLFDWSSLAIAKADILEGHYQSLRDQFITAEDTINQLNQQLEDLISSKTQHEQQLMSVFVQLLNEKKLKIRNQQRLLASANVDHQKLTEMQAATATDDSNPKAKSRRSKRPPQPEVEDSESEDGFEKMPVDKAKRQADNEADEETNDEDRSTPEPLEDEADTTSDDEGPPPRTKEPQRASNQEQRPPRDVSAKSPPPRRELPFARKTGNKSASMPPPPGEQDSNETGGETDDDEL